MRYRRSVYRKKRIKATVISIIIGVLVLILIFAVIGNSVGNKVDENISNRKNSTTDSSQTEHADIKSVLSFPVPLSADGSKLSARLAQAASKGYTEVCFTLSDSEGTAHYSSPFLQEAGRQSYGIDLWKLEEAVKLCSSNGLYSTGIIYLYDLKSDSDLTRAAAIGFYSAQISEALRSGINDILLTVPDTLSTDNYGELAELADEVHRLCPSGNIGISLSPEIYSDASDIADTLWKHFDYLAVDVYSTDGGDTLEYLNEKLGSMLYYLLRYEVRVLVPYTDDTELSESIIGAVKSFGAQNIQIMQNQ